MSKKHRQNRDGFTEHENSKNTAFQQRTRQAMREAGGGGSAKHHGKTQKATVKHRGTR
ncbi:MULTISPECIES: hypothetical protein [unclassified Streptomyces]|uniref:hypothetical protein n=1 Tax=unclassified Streptomyces TaxID=2593676 RepID=UPI0022B604D9|nr:MULTISPECIES: hypothetical protein [unclassified Streptomyces]MCZ7415172.1 hypothetical protein [Streptomyces sp. WMMC897]MCZ7432115.1 hypothetical protein [Streptomyces sp. WMMC1477]